MRLFDTHSHLDQEEFAADRSDVVARAVLAGVETIIAVGVTAETSAACVAHAAQFSGVVYAAVGIQPNYCAQAQPGDWDRIVELAAQPGVVALGETGLDKYWDYSPLDLQTVYFQRHLELSRKTGLPFIVHTRECDAEILEALRTAAGQGPLNGVMHSFTGAPETAEICQELDLYISFAGMVTFKKSTALRELAATVQPDRLLIETDSPYLSPHPLRGKRNEPANLVHTLASLAEARGVSTDELARITTENARRLFKLGRS